MAKTEGNKYLGIYISPKEICFSQVKIGRDSKPEPEHLIKFPTDFPVKEGMMRPLSLNHEFFSEKASWLAPFKQAVKKVSWDTTNVVVTLSPQFAILRYFVMPVIERRFWNKSIPLESKKYIPVSFEEVVYDFNPVPAEGGKKLGVLFGLTQRKSVEFISETLKACGFTLSAVEITPVSMERLFGFLDQKEHDSKGYIHFSENSTYMLFSHGGYPVLYRETESDSSGTMSERKRLDVKGAMQFVDRYVGGKEYKAIAISGDGTDIWQPLTEKEAAPIPVQVWDSAGACGLKNNDAAAIFAGGYPVLYRETESDSSGTMSERKRLDVKGAMQFVDRYVGGKEYKAIAISGDGTDVWQPLTEKEAAPIPVQVWDSAGACGLKSNDAAAIFASGAALRGRTPGPMRLDISGISTTAVLEKQVQNYVWYMTFVLGGLLLFLSLIAQVRILMLTSEITSLKAKGVNVPELDGMEAEAIQKRIGVLQTNSQILDGLVSDVDPIAPKLAAIADRISPDLWLSNLTYTNPFTLSEAQSGAREVRLIGETYLRGERKLLLVDAFSKSLKASPEFKTFTPPFGSIGSTTEEGGAASDLGEAGGPKTRKTSGFTVICTFKRK